MGRRRHTLKMTKPAGAEMAVRILTGEADNNWSEVLADLENISAPVSDNATAEDGLPGDRATVQLCIEVARQWNAAAEFRRGFTGRRDVLDSIRQYVCTASKDGGMLVVSGKRGVGKSAVMAEVANSVARWLEAAVGYAVRPAVLLRHCSPADSTASILRGLSDQLDRAGVVVPQRGVSFQGEISSCSRNMKFSEVKRRLRSNLIDGRVSRFVVIIVDAVDEIKNARELIEWMPTRLADNIKVILSCSTGTTDGTCAALLTQCACASSQVVVNCLEPEESLAVFRSLSSVMCNDSFAEMFADNDVIFDRPETALFVRLLVDEMRDRATAKLITAADVATLAQTTLKDLVKTKFERLERTHGRVLVSRCLGYLTLATADGGLSDDEMIDLLSLDDDVMADVLPRKSGCDDVRESRNWRFPTEKWGSLRDDLLRVLASRLSGETRLANRALTELAEGRYARTPGDKSNLYSHLAEYYLGTWSCGRRKPYRLAGESCTVPPAHSADRRVAEQPLKYSCGTVNARKLRRLPTYLHRSNRKSELRREVLFNFAWLRTKLTAIGVQETLADYDELFPTESEADAVAGAVRSVESTSLVEDVDSLAIELTGRLMCFYSRSENIRALIDQCDATEVARSRVCSVIPMLHVYNNPGGLLKDMYNLEDDVERSARNSDGSLIVEQEAGSKMFLVSKYSSDEHRMQRWDLTNSGERLEDIVLTTRVSHRLFSSSDGKLIHMFVDGPSTSIFQSCRLSNGDICCKIDLDGSWHKLISGGKAGPKAVVVTEDAVLFSGLDPGPLGLTVLNIRQSSVVRRLPYSSRCIAATFDGRYFACDADTSTVALHELPLCERRLTASTSSSVRKLEFGMSVGKASTTPPGKETLQLFVLEADQIVRSLCVEIARVGDVVSCSVDSKVVFRDCDINDIRSSRMTGSRLLIRRSRSIHVVNCDAAATRSIQTTTLTLPESDFQRNPASSVVIIDADFATKNDWHVIGAIGNAFCVWKTVEKYPIYVLRPSLHPIVSVFKSRFSNVVITVDSEHTFYHWDLKNIEDSCIAYCSPKAYFRGQIGRLAGANCGNRFMCAASSGDTRVIVVETTSGQVYRELHCPADMDEASTVVDDVSISDGGNYAVVRWKQIRLIAGQEELITKTVIWNITTGNAIRTVEDCNFVLLCADESLAFLVKCQKVECDKDDDNLSYSAAVVGFDLKRCLEVGGLTLPEGTIFGKPVAVTSGVGAWSVILLHQPRLSLTSRGRHLCVCSGFGSSERRVQTLHVGDILTQPDPEVVFVRVRGIETDGCLLVVFGRHQDNDADAEPESEKTLKQFAAIFRPDSMQVLHIFKHWLPPNVDFDSILISRDASVFVDGNLVAYNYRRTDSHELHDDIASEADSMPLKEHPVSMSLADVTNRNCPRLLFDSARLIAAGRFLVGIEADRRRVAIVSTVDGTVARRVPVNGRATRLDVCAAADGEVLLVGCDDGRVASFALAVGRGKQETAERIHNMRRLLL